MTEYLITAKGCDDHTRTIVDLTDDEFVVARKIAEAVTGASWSGCMPRLSVRAATKADVEAVEEDRREHEAEMADEAE